ncbi:MAG TPA: hypothetical protein VGC65_00125 [Bacteroidia bacterium]|jgi:hypothetical protein
MKKLNSILCVCFLLGAFAHVSLASATGDRGGTKTDLVKAPVALELNVVEFAYETANLSNGYVFVLVAEVKAAAPLNNSTTAILADAPVIPFDHGIYLGLSESCYLSPHVDNSYRWKLAHFHSC